MQHIFEQERQAKQEERKVTEVFYAHGDQTHNHQTYKCQHTPIYKLDGEEYFNLNENHPHNLFLVGIGSYFRKEKGGTFPPIEERVDEIERCYQDIAKKIRESRKTGQPITPDGLKEKDETTVVKDEKKKEDAGLMFQDLNLTTFIALPIRL